MSREAARRSGRRNTCSEKQKKIRTPGFAGTMKWVWWWIHPSVERHIAEVWTCQLGESRERRSKCDCEAKNVPKNTENVTKGNFGGLRSQNIVSLK